MGVNPTALQEKIDINVLAVDQKVAGSLVLKQATFTGNLSNAGTATIAALDATGGPMKDIKIKVYYSGATAGLGITPQWFATRYGSLITFTQQNVPSLGAQHVLAGAIVEDYLVGDLPSELQGELRVNSAGNDSALTFEATVTYLQ